MLPPAFLSLPCGEVYKAPLLVNFSLLELLDEIRVSWKEEGNSFWDVQGARRKREGNWHGKYTLVNRHKQAFPKFGDYAVKVTTANIFWAVSWTIPLEFFLKIHNCSTVCNRAAYLRGISTANVMTSTINSDTLKLGLWNSARARRLVICHLEAVLNKVFNFSP